MEGRWRYKRDGHDMHERLAGELKQITGADVIDIEPEPQVGKGFVGYGADPT